MRSTVQFPVVVPVLLPPNLARPANPAQWRPWLPQVCAVDRSRIFRRPCSRGGCHAFCTERILRRALDSPICESQIKPPAVPPQDIAASEPERRALPTGLTYEHFCGRPLHGSDVQANTPTRAPIFFVPAVASVFGYHAAYEQLGLLTARPARLSLWHCCSSLCCRSCCRVIG